MLARLWRREVEALVEPPPLMAPEQPLVPSAATADRCAT